MNSIFLDATEAMRQVIEVKRENVKKKIDKAIEEGATYTYIDLGTPKPILDELKDKGYGVTRSGASTYLVDWFNGGQ